MNNQEILKLKIAPGFVSVKIFKGDTGYNPTTKHYRSLADIKRIVELEAYLQKVQADRINDIAIERKRWSKADLVALEILRLEQQAKGLIDYAETRYKNVKRGQYHHKMMSAGRLQIEAEALKESKWINCRASLPDYGDPVTVKDHGVVQNVTYTLSGAGDDFDEKLDWFEPYYLEDYENRKIPLSNNIEWMPLPKTEALKDPNL
jgi:hypothetical protein